MCHLVAAGCLEEVVNRGSVERHRTASAVSPTDERTQGMNLRQVQRVYCEGAQLTGVQRCATPIGQGYGHRVTRMQPEPLPQTPVSTHGDQPSVSE